MTIDRERLQEVLSRKAEDLSKRSPMTVGDRTIPNAPPRATVESAGPGRRTAEAIIMWNRPALVIENDRFIDPTGGASDQLLAAIEANRAQLDGAIPSVGRIELANNIHYPWVGTGWLLAGDLGTDVVVTNAHVAREFGMRSGGRWVFRPGIPDFTHNQSAVLDFREELGAAVKREFPITEVLWISEDPALDMALLRVARTIQGDTIGRPIPLSTETSLDPGRMLAVVGYPGSGGDYDPEKFREMFGTVLGKKRFSPGVRTQDRTGFLCYDASTLPGSSGSVVLDVQTGTALGLHFAGTAFDTNFAVGAASILKILRDQPWRTEAVSAPPPMLASSGGGVRGEPANELRLVIPLEITIRLSSSGLGGVTSIGLSSSADTTSSTSAEAAAGRVRAHLTGKPEVLSVRAGYLFRAGEITDDLGVIVGVRPGASLDPSQYGLGATLDGVSVSVELADPETVVSREFGIVREAFSQRRANYARDLSDPRFDLSPVTGRVRIVLHVSPEAGWPMLQTFLARNDCEQFTVGMYHMTAPHVVAAIKDIAERARSRITLTIDRQKGEGARPDDTSGDTKKDDIPEKRTLSELEGLADERFKWAPASLGSQGLFASAYHIKVAVWTDRLTGGRTSDKAFWLSSGNWQSSNQAPITKAVADLTWEDVRDYNREWHAIVEHEGLAATFRNHLDQDYVDNAAAAAVEARQGPAFDLLVPEALLERPRRPSRFQAFEPLELDEEMTVQPLLTPDNYPEVILGLISAATERVLIENQSFAFWKEPASMPRHFVAILEAIRARQRAGLDVRIIFRSGFGNERDVLRAMKTFGIRADAQHARYFDTCHTKGIVIDQDIVVLGSQNLTAGGTGPNRDASLVIWNRKANKYFADLFEYDWRQVGENRARGESAVRESVRLVPAGLEAPTPEGFRRISLAEYLGET